MSTPVTATEVAEQSWIKHDDALCHVTEKRNTEGGGVFLGWTEDLNGREVYFHGTFTPGSYFGETTSI